MVAMELLAIALIISVVLCALVYDKLQTQKYHNAKYYTKEQINQ